MIGFIVKAVVQVVVVELATVVIRAIAKGKK